MTFYANIKSFMCLLSLLQLAPRAAGYTLVSRSPLTAVSSIPTSIDQWEYEVISLHLISLDREPHFIALELYLRFGQVFIRLKVRFYHITLELNTKQRTDYTFQVGDTVFSANFVIFLGLDADTPLHTSVTSHINMAAPIGKIQLFGHSFVRRLKDFIRSSEDCTFSWNLDGPPMIQYSGFPGADVHRLRNNIEVIEDFDPDVVFLFAGTNDLYHAWLSPADLASRIVDLVKFLLDSLRIKKVVVLSITHRCPSSRTRYPVNIDWFNTRVDQTNAELSERLQELNQGRTYLWRLKGFWSPSAKEKVFDRDGCHLSASGQRKLIANLRAATVAIQRRFICSPTLV